MLVSRVLAVILTMAALSLGGCTFAPDKPTIPDTLPECGLLLNCVNTQSGRYLQGHEPIHATDEQWRKLKTWIANEDDWQVVADDGDFMQAVAITPVFRFRDDVQLLFLQQEQVIEVRSSSRLGLSDLGANSRRIDQLKAVVADSAASVSATPAP